MSASQQQGRRVWAELSGLMESEHASLTEENQQLKRQISEISSELQSLKEQVSACLLNTSGSHRRQAIDDEVDVLFLDPPSGRIKCETQRTCKNGRSRKISL